MIRMHSNTFHNVCVAVAKRRPTNVLELSGVKNRTEPNQTKPNRTKREKTENKSNNTHSTCNFLHMRLVFMLYYGQRMKEIEKNPLHMSHILGQCIA